MAERTMTLARPGVDLAVRSRAALAPEAWHMLTLDGARAGIGDRVVARQVQPRLLVGPADDPFEREAERAAASVTSDTPMPSSAFDAAPLASRLMRFVRRAVGKTEPATKNDDEQKRAQKSASGAGPEAASPGIEAGVARMSAGGDTLPGTVRSTFESRFGLDFGDVRIHTGGEAAGAAIGLGARAFTIGDHIFFGPGQYEPSSPAGQHLIAHELTHTIQQKSGAARAARLLAAPRRVQRALSGIKAEIAEKIRNYVTGDFPPWDLITLIVGYDPIRQVNVKGATRDWIKAAMKLAPDGVALFDKLDGAGKVDAIAAWWDGEVAKLDLNYDKLVSLVDRALGVVEPLDVLSPLATWNKKIKPIFEPVVKRVWDFIKAVGVKVYQVVRDLVLKSVGEWAQKQKGYPLLTMALGKDPVTGEEVKPTLKGVIFAVLDLVDGGDKIKENLEKSKTIEKAATWFKTEFLKLKLTWEGIKALFSEAWDAFKVVDLLNPKLLFEKMWGIFGPPVTRLLAFLLAVAKKILEFIFEGAMLIAGPIGLQIVGIVRKIGDTFGRIVDDPVAFVGHLIDAVKKGITQFAKNIWEHLKTGMIAWLTGTLGDAGLTLPKVWDLKGILDLVLQILGITWPKIRAKLVVATSERTVSMLETAFGFIKTLVTEGPAAAWKEIVAAIGNLWDMVIGGIKDWAVTKIVTAAITKLATMFNPAGAVIQAIIAIYNTVAFFIERIKQILDFVESVVDSIANIALGKIDAAANYVEKAMARTIPVILGFLARLIGLGDVSRAVKKVITAIQEKVDKAIDSVIKFVVEKAKSLFAAKAEAPPPAPGAALTPEQATAVKAAALDDTARALKGSKLRSLPEAQQALDRVYTKHRPAGLKSLSLVVTDEATLGLQVVAKASDPERRTVGWAEAFAPDDEARALFESQPRFETNAAVSIDGARFGEVVASNDAGHAEQNLISRYWSAVLKVVAANRAKGQKSTIVIAINRAPCHTKCTAALIDAIGRVPAADRAAATFVLAPTGVYEPTQNLQDTDVDEAEKRYAEMRTKLRAAGHDLAGYTVISRSRLTEHTTRMSDLVKLSNAGWDLRQLAVRPKPTSAGIVLAEAAHKLAEQAGRIKAGAA